MKNPRMQVRDRWGWRKCDLPGNRSTPNLPLVGRALGLSMGAWHQAPAPGLGKGLWGSVSPPKDSVLTTPSSGGPPQLLTFGSPSWVSKHGESSMDPRAAQERPTVH